MATKPAEPGTTDAAPEPGAIAEKVIQAEVDGKRHQVLIDGVLNTYERGQRG